MKLSIIFSLFLLSTFANAADCTLKITRTACPGKEEEMLKPYNGKNPTEDKEAVVDEAACKVAGEKAAKIVRKGVLAKKTVNVSYAGKEIAVSSNEKECK